MELFTLLHLLGWVADVPRVLLALLLEAAGHSVLLLRHQVLVDHVARRSGTIDTIQRWCLLLLRV